MQGILKMETCFLEEKSYSVVLIKLFYIRLNKCVLFYILQIYEGAEIV